MASERMASITLGFLKKWGTRWLRLPAESCSAILRMRRKPFSMNTFQGIFRNARGASPPFIDVYECQDGKEIAFKTVQEKSEISLDSKGHLAELFSATAELLTGKTQG